MLYILALLLSRAFKQKVTTAYGGIIGRAENQEMVKSLRLPFSHVRNLNFKRYRHFALVDTQPRSGNNQLPSRTVADVVIDHHPLRATTQVASFHDVRPKYGATATLLAEYMLAAGVQPTHALATALIYAIRSETLDFAREHIGPDKAIHDLFFPLANHKLLARIQSPRLPLTYFGNLHDALENLESVDSLVLSHLGAVEQPDIVPEIADLLLRLEGKTWRRILGRRGKGGGHGMIAGGWIDASKMTVPAERRELQRKLGARLARELKKNPERLARVELRRQVG